jgi:DNA-binding SARP family transcriptional activator
MAIDLRVLGCFRLIVDDHDVDISAVPARILAYLALRPDAVQRSSLAGVLWPDVTRERALGNLRSALWRLPPGTRGAVDESGTWLRLHDAVQCDLTVQRRAGSLPEGSVPAALSWASSGELLAGWYDDWVVAARESLQVRRADLLESWATRSIASGRSGDALLFATLAVGIQPLRETAHRTLLSAHLAQGNHGEARALFRDLERMLRRELGVAPSRETSAVMSAALEGVA